MVQCDALKRLVEVLDSSSTENDGLRKYVSTSLKLLADALNVPNPHHHTQRTHKHKEKYPNQLEETASGSTTICTDTKVKCLPIYSLMNEEGTFCVLAPLQKQFHALAVVVVVWSLLLSVFGM
jgi:hypothetical protein